MKPPVSLSRSRTSSGRPSAWTSKTIPRWTAPTGFGRRSACRRDELRASSRPSSSSAHSRAKARHASASSPSSTGLRWPPTPMLACRCSRAIAAGIGALHEEDPRSVANDDIRNELLVRRILLGGRSIEVAAVGRDGAPERRERGLVGRPDSAEVATTRHRRSGEDQHTLRHRPPSLPIGCQVGGKVGGIDCVSIPFRTALHRTAQRASKCGADRQQPRSETVVRGETRY